MWFKIQKLHKSAQTKVYLSPLSSSYAVPFWGGNFFFFLIYSGYGEVISWVFLQLSYLFTNKYILPFHLSFFIQMIAYCTHCFDLAFST